ncbi:MAG: hypothetical protein ACREX3_11435 [Gammaproteobacteria bacterium]
MDRHEPAPSIKDEVVREARALITLRLVVADYTLKVGFEGHKIESEIGTPGRIPLKR